MEYRAVLDRVIRGPWLRCNMDTVFQIMALSVKNIRRSWHRLIIIMGIPILVRIQYRGGLLAPHISHKPECGFYRNKATFVFAWHCLLRTYKVLTRNARATLPLTLYECTFKLTLYLTVLYIGIVWQMYKNQLQIMACLRSKCNCGISLDLKGIQQFQWLCGCKSLFSVLLFPEHVIAGITFSWASNQTRKIAGCSCGRNAGNVFPATDFKGNH